MHRCSPLPQAMTVASMMPWREAARFSDRVSTPSDGNLALATEPRTLALGPVEIVHWAGGPGLVLEAPEKRGRNATPCYTVLLQASGASRLSHYGLVSTLDAGHLVLINNAAPHRIVLTEEGELVVLHVPLPLLRAYLPSPEQFCGRPLQPDDGISECAAEFLLGICAQLDQGLSEEFRSRIARNLLDLLATAFSLALDGRFTGSPVIGDRNARVRLYIEEHLRDPELCPSAIAVGLRLSPRYLRAIFAASKETVSAYILRRRLEECARELPNPILQHLSITDVAFGWGFNSGPHFARSFRGHFGMSPRDYRRMGLDHARQAVI